jgi:DNA mismatch repair protein MutS
MTLDTVLLERTGESTIGQSAWPGTYSSILFVKQEGTPRETVEAPAFFVDLNLDQVIDAITAGKQEYNLQPFFYTPLRDLEAIQYRHEVMRDLENRTLFERIGAFANEMRAMREHLAQADKLYYKYQKERWFLDAVELYCDAVAGLVNDLSLVELGSRGFVAFREFLRSYAESDRFATLQTETKQLLATLSGVTYCFTVKGNAVTVRKCEAEADYSAEVEATFAKFKQGAAKDYRVGFRKWPEMNHVEAQVLDGVAQLYPDIFARLDDYCAENRNYLEEALGAFDREVQFYVAYLEYIKAFKRLGLPFCYPQVSATSKEVHDYAAFDLALAYKLLGKDNIAVTNDFYLKDPERIIVVSGPNQGGKTTFARTFGQLHYLASLGCPVPGREAQLFLFDQLFTHFEREEDITSLHGKLQDDLVRIYDILNQATPESIVIINEIFTSTTLQDAILLGKKVMEKIIALDLLCVCVTFIDELASLNEKTVSMVSTVVPDNPTERTYKILRRPADGLSYALSIAEKYGLTYACLKEQIRE